MLAVFQPVLPSTPPLPCPSQGLPEVSVPEAPSLRVTLLGPPRFEWEGQTLPLAQLRQAALLSYLALHPGGVARSELAELLWGPGKLPNLRQALYKLRQLPQADHWLDAQEQVLLRAQTDVARAEAAARQGDWASVLSLLEQQSGQPRVLLDSIELPGAEVFGEWLEQERARLGRLYLEALQAHTQILERTGDGAGALPFARRLAQLLPYDAEVQQTLIRLEYQHASPEAALLGFERHRAALRADLNEEPQPATLALIESLSGRGGGRGVQARWLEAPPLSTTPDLTTAEELFGRADELHRLQLDLSAGARVLLQGFGGLGKTALALAAARSFLHGGQRVLWLELGRDGAETVQDGLAELLKVQASARGSAATRAQELSRALGAAQPALVVLDNAANPYALARALEVMPPGLPLLVTSRLRHPGLLRHSLGVLDRSASLELLLAHAPHISPHDPRADALCALLGDHAYSLRLAALTLHRQAAQPAALLAQLQAAPHALGGEEGVTALLGYSLGTLSDEAYEVFLGLGGLFAPRGTPELLSLALRRESEASERALYELVQVGLATREALPGQDAATFRLHDLAWSYARERHLLRPSSALRAALSYTERHSAETALLDIELPNILGAAEYARQHGAGAELAALTLGLVGGEFLWERGNPPGLLEVLRAAASAAEAGGDLRAAQALWGKVGDVHKSFLADHAAAAAAYQTALGLARLAAWPQREVIYAALLVWSLTLTNAPEARVDALLAEAGDLAERLGDPLLVCRILEAGAFVYARRGQAEQARARLVSGYTLLRGLLARGAEPREQIRASLQVLTFNLGQAERRLGHLELALGYKREALHLAEDRDEAWGVARACADVGELLGDLTRREEALPYLHRAEELSLRLGMNAELSRVRELIARTTLPGERLTAT
ncbi:BTAD domain-containing putative transcriptional regulator [Deinococcus sp.]|uniref:BTAD domain-containing putative transcriptional regulator n=1 Tax=Deinococcus sp. TaxID=47478 RepID=UPI003CC50604